MNDEIAERLRALPPNLPDQPDRFELVRSKVVRRRRNRTIISSVLAAAVIVAGVSVATAGNSPSQNNSVDAADQSGAPESQPFPDPPEGSKWVGMNRVVVAVPADWPVTETQCNDTPSKVVVSVSGLNRACAPNGETARVTFALNDVTKPAPVGPPECQLSDPPTCYGARDFADEGVTVRVSFGGEDASRDVERILDSAMALPDGWTTVPVGGEESMTSRRAVLTEAGFDIYVPLQDADNHAVRSEPESGSPVREGATITLLPLEQEQNPETLDLTVTVSRTQPEDDLGPTGSAVWNADEQAVTYVPDVTYYGSCLPVGRATQTGSSMTLEMTVPLRDGICSPDAIPTTVTISGLTEAPTELTVTEDGEARTVPVKQESETRELNVLIRPLQVIVGGESEETAYWYASDNVVRYRPSKTYGSCLPKGTAELNGAKASLTLIESPDSSCQGLGMPVNITISGGLTEAPTELVITENGVTRSVPVG